MKDKFQSLVGMRGACGWLNDPLITHLSPTNHPLKHGVGKVLTMVVLLFTFGIGNVWADTQTYSFASSAELSNFTYTAGDASDTWNVCTSKTNNVEPRDGGFVQYKCAKSGKIATFVTASSFDNISNISFYIASSDKGKTQVKIEVSSKADFSSDVTEIVNATGGLSGLGISSPANNTWYSVSKSVASKSGYVRFTMTASSSGKYWSFDDIVITYTPSSGGDPVCPSGLTISSKDSKTAFTEGDAIELTASLTAGNGDISYQWYKGGTAEGNKLTGKTTNKLQIASCTTADEGSYYCVASKTSCDDAVNTSGFAITVATVEPTGTATISYALSGSTTTGTVTGVNSISSLSSSLTLSTLTLSGTKDGYSGAIKGCTSTTELVEADYVDVQFTVGNGYVFTPSAVTVQVNPFGATGAVKAVVKVMDAQPLEVASNELACAKNTDNAVTFASGAFTNKKFEGTVHLRMYFYGAASDKTFYLKSPISITGTVAADPKYDVIFANGGEGTGDMATLKYEAGEEVTLPACGYTPVSGREFNGWTSSDVTISAGKFEMPAKNVTITATWRDEAVKYTVTYDVNGGSSATPTETDKAAGDEFALAAAPEYDGYHFEGWLCDADAVTYDAEDAYTMTAANTTFTAQWKPYSTISIANKTYIIGSGNFNAVSDFSSNCEAAVIYELKESYPGVTFTPAGVFSATAAGEYIVVANQAGDATYAATSKEFTVTVLDNELSDTYVWKKGTGYTGCVANPNADAPAAQYTDIAYEGFTGMGRAAADNTECILTFTVKAAYSATFGIKSICTYGKLEEPAGGQISWDGGTSWEDLAAYSEGKKEFNAPAATFPTSFKIRFLGVSKDAGGLYWRNALVTLEAKKTVTGVTEALVGAEINGEAISAANLATLLEDKTLDIATAYAAAPTVTFKKQVTTTYSGGWAPDVTNVDVEVTASDNTTAWQASATIGGQAYIINLAKPAGPSLETEATAFTLTSAKVATDTKKFTFSGMNLTSGNVTIALESAVAGMTVTPAEVTPTAGVITDQEVTITYKSLEDVAEANVNLVVYYDADTKIVLPLTYSSTKGYEDLTSISAATTWNWNGAADAAVGTVVDKAQMIILANADATWAEGFNARAIAGKLEYMYRDGKYAQGDELKFNTTIPGKVYVTYSNTGGNDPRTVNVNGTKGSLSSSNNKDADKRTESFAVSAGDVLIKGVQVSDDAAKYLRYYEVRFAPVFAVTYDAGEGSVKGGETMPTQADEAAGEKIILAAATALEKDGYDFAGWLCDIDAQTYQPGDEYTMTAVATTFTAQWVLHVDPVDPTLTYDNGAYTIGLAALDLSSLITAQTSTGAITYSVKTDGGTGAAIDGNNFTATAAGTATITASQAAVLGYNAITVDFNVVVTEATEIDGIKMVVAEALTGNFVSARTLSDGNNTIEGIAYTKYLTMSSTMTSFGNEVAPSATKGIYYYPMHKNIRFYFYVYNNQSSAKKIYIYTVDEDAEGTSDATSANVSVDPGRHLVYADVELTKHAAVVFGVENTGTQICQIVAVESGDELLQGGEAGYTIDYNKCYISPKAGTVAVYDGIEYKLYADAKLVSATNVQLQTLGTDYIKFHLDAPMTVNVYADNKKYYIGSECSTDDAAMLYEATGDGEFSLAAGNWYINGSGAQVKINKLSFSAPKCAEPEFNALANSDLCEGDSYVALDGTATVADAGTVSYKWYAEGADESDPAAVIGTDATYLPSADGKYYVIATNSLSGYTDNVKKSDLVSVTTFASAAITAEPENVRMNAGEEATLTVAATGKNLSYEWFTCDDAEGTNPVAIVPAETGASLTVTVTAGMNQYYKVVVSSDCGNASAVALVEEWSELPQVSVSATTTWDWQYAGPNIKLTDDTTTPKKNEECLMANVKVGGNMPTNDATFNSQALVFYGENVRAVESSRAYASIGHISFKVTVPGMVTVEFSDNGNNNRKLKINNAISESSASKTDVKTFSAIVPAGEVVLEGVNGDGTGNNRYIRISKIIFDANPDPAGADYTRDVTEGRYGTICLPNGGVMVGAEIFEIAYYGETSQKIFLDNIISGEMEAGIPYIFLPKEGASKLAVFYTDEENAPAGSKNGLVGFIGASADEYYYITAGDGNYILQNNLYREVAAGAQARILSNRAYIHLAGINPSEPALAPGRRRISMSVMSEQVATGCENLQVSEKPVKMIIDGQLFILRGEKLYDAKGQLVK